MRTTILVGCSLNQSKITFMVCEGLFLWAIIRHVEQKTRGYFLMFPPMQGQKDKI